jgi:hypothetical protein
MIVLGAVYVSPLANGRPSLVKLDIFVKEKGAERIYRDAVIGDTFGHTKHEWVHALADRTRDNLQVLRRSFSSQQREFVFLVLAQLLAAIPIGLIWGGIKRDGLALSGAALLLVTLTFVCICYTFRHDRPVRVSLVAYPLVALMEARLLTALFDYLQSRRPPDHSLGQWPQALSGAVIAASVLSLSFKGFTNMMSHDYVDDRGYVFINSLPMLDTRSVLVAPHLLGVPYINRNPKVTYAFVPANRKTLELLCARYPVETLILDRDDAIDLTEQDVIDQGLRPYSRVRLEGGHLIIFRRPSYPGEEWDWNTEQEEVFTYSPRRRVRN